jgi:hypothetical protein
MSEATAIVIEADRHSCLSAWDEDTCRTNRRDFPFLIFQLSFANSSLKCNRTLFVASPQRGEMFIAWRSFLYSEAP